MVGTYLDQCYSNGDYLLIPSWLPGDVWQCWEICLAVMTGAGGVVLLGQSV